MNKLVKLVLILVPVFALTGCNKQIVDLKYTYTEAHCNYNGDEFTLKIKKWNDYDGEQIQIVDENDNTYLLSTNNCYLKK